MSVQQLEAAIENLSPDEVEELAVWLADYRGRVAPSDAGAFSLLREAAGSLEMPSDWAQQHDHYLTGAPINKPVR